MADEKDICRRIAQVRLETTGPRGKSRFAGMLDLAPSTYEYYESDRVPPATVLVRIAEQTGVDLRWLLTGEDAADVVPADHPILQRAARLLADRSEAADPLAAFLDILEQTLAFPAEAHDAGCVNESAGHVPAGQGRVDFDRSVAAGKAGQPGSRVGLPAAPDGADLPAVGMRQTVAEPAPASPEAWIPILGRSAAGVLAWWADDDAAGMATLGEKIDTHAASAAAVQPASLNGPCSDARDVQLVTLREPIGPSETAEFVVAPQVKHRHPDAFAVRIDGESMSPEIHHGDLVLLSPSQPAVAGKVAVVQVAGAIGVTCKLYHPEGTRVHLVPINEAIAPACVDADDIEWALRVLATIRP